MGGSPEGEMVPGGGSADRRNAVRGVAWGGVESATRAGVAFLITPLIIGAVGIEGLGLWAVCWSMASISGMFDLGIGATYARFAASAIARGDARALNGTVAAGTGFLLIVTAILAGIAMVLAPFLEAGISRGTPFADVALTVLGCAVATVLLRLVLSVFRGVMMGSQRLDVLGRLGAAVAILEGGAMAAFILTGGGLRGMALIALAATILSLILEAHAAYRYCPQLRVRPFCARRSDWREVLSFGLKVQVIRAAEIAARHVPRLVLAAGPGLAVAGLYDLGARVASVLNTAGGLPLPVIAPMASRLDAQGLTERMLSLLRRSTRYVALLVVPLTTLIMLDAPGFLLAWTGLPESDGASTTARLLAMAATLALLVSPLRLTLRGMGNAGLEAVSAMSASTLHLILALALAVRWGAPGVAWSACIASILGAAILGVGARGIASGEFTNSIRQSMAGPVLGGIVAFVVGWVFKSVIGTPAGIEATRLVALTHLSGEAVVVLTVFALVAAAAGGIRREDLSLVRVAAKGA